MVAFSLDGLPVIRDVVLHVSSGLLAWPAKGVIYGRLGAPVGALCSDGYIRLGGGRGGRCMYAHRLIWEAVHGPIPAGLEVDHRNGKKADNRIVNLDLVTRAENVRRAFALGLAAVGEACSYSRLTEEQVCEIRASALPTRTWAAMLGLDPSTIRLARRGSTWRHVACRGRRPVKQRRSRRGGAR
jgi:hypothetical protein